MGESVPPYARRFDEPIAVSHEVGGIFSRGGEYRVEFRAGDEHCATLYPHRRRRVGRAALATLDFGQRQFALDMPDDRTLGEGIREWWNQHRRRRVWRAGMAVAAEIRDVTERSVDPVGTFDRDGTRYRVEREIKWWPVGAHDAASVIANHREVAQIDACPDSRGQLLITPSTSLRLDVLLIAYHMYDWLFVTGSSGGGGGDGGGC